MCTPIDGACTHKLLQELDQADVHAQRARDSHASGGVVSLSIRCGAPCFCFRIRDPSIRLRWFRVGGSYMSHLVRMRTSEVVYEPKIGHMRPGGGRMRPAGCRRVGSESKKVMPAKCYCTRPARSVLRGC